MIGQWDTQNRGPSSGAVGDDESVAHDLGLRVPLDRKIGFLDDAGRLWFAATCQAEGQAVLGVQRPGILRFGGEQYEAAECHEASMPLLCQLGDVSDLALDVQFQRLQGYNGKQQSDGGLR